MDTAREGGTSEGEKPDSQGEDSSAPSSTPLRLKPLVIIAHGLSGVVVKQVNLLAPSFHNSSLPYLVLILWPLILIQALLLALREPQYHSIIQRTCRLVILQDSIALNSDAVFLTEYRYSLVAPIGLPSPGNNSDSKSHRYMSKPPNR